MKTIFIIFSVIILFESCDFSNAQSFGFGCIGFTGAFGGYSYQKYNPSELNDYINSFNQIRTDSLVEPMNSFGHARGFKVGINFFRKKYKHFFFTTKGFYQLLVERKNALEKLSTGNVSTNFETKLTTWGLGFDVGTPIISFLNWKIIEAAIVYNQAKFSNTQNFPGAVTIVKNYKSDFSFGYTIGSGVIVELFGEYITLEGSALYSKISIGEIQNENSVKLTKHENSDEVIKNFISDGGLNAVIQLNIGIPL